MRFSIFVLIFIAQIGAVAQQPIQLTGKSDLSPDGSQIVFSWRGDLWITSIDGGMARQLTHDQAKDSSPKFSPDGSQIAFISDRTGVSQVHVVPIDGGQPKQLTFHTESSIVESWHPNGDQIVIRGSRDHFWRSAYRFFTISANNRGAEKLIFDAYGRDGSFSIDGQKILFTREGMHSWRKGYVGSKATQIWIYDLAKKTFSKIVHHETDSRSPIWSGSGFYYVGGQSGSLNLWFFDLQTETEKQLTFFDDDFVGDPCVAGDTIVFRHLFDLYRFRPKTDKSPKKLEIFCQTDLADFSKNRRTFKKATSIAFSNDALEIAFVAGGDLFVMDTELREPIQITKTPEEEREPIFSINNSQIFFVSDADDQCDIWRAERSDPEKFWWQNEKFELKKLTDDPSVEAQLKIGPVGEKIAFAKNRGDLWIADLDGKNQSRLIESWNVPNYDWSPDGKWIAYSINDNDFNIDVWITPIDNSSSPINISKHPYDQVSPRWSPDGKAIAFTSQRRERELDIAYVWLAETEDDLKNRDRKIEKAIKKMEKHRKKDPKKSEDEKSEKEKKEEKKLPEVKIDFDRIHERIRTVSIKDSTEANLFWSHDSKKLAFTAKIDGKRGTYTIELTAEKIEPKLLTTKTGSQPRWLKIENQIVWNSGGTPAIVSAKGDEKKFPFEIKTEIALAAHHKVAFDLAWRTMRDHFYDGNLGNRNWNAIRRKYAPMAEKSINKTELAKVINLMLGELNGSHLGFYPSADHDPKPKNDWQITTAHFGVRFDPTHIGVGLKVKDVIPNSPADQIETRLEVGEIILRIDGVEVDLAIDLTSILNGRIDRDVKLEIQNVNGEIREIEIRPISFRRARSLLYEKWIRDNREKIEARSKNLGYVHIRGMNWSSFERFEREIYAIGFGKEGLIIDVRDNGGGFTTDHLLTMLTQPTHAITVPRGGGRGYPEGRKIYATWDKPIVVLCNQNSFSNAEIFSHAIKSLGRGQLIGMPTAGGVISTGGRKIMDVGFLRMPFRGWFIAINGEDMELNGATPDQIVEMQPSQQPKGIDPQLDKAIEVLLAEIERWKAEPIQLRKASDRNKKGE